MSTAPQLEGHHSESRWRGPSLVAIFFFACVGAEWFADGVARRICALTAIGVALIGIWTYGRFGIDRRNRFPSQADGWFVIGGATIGGLILCGLTAIALGSWHGENGFAGLRDATPDWLLIKLPTVVAQQVALHLFIVPAMRSAIARPIQVALAGATLFAALHIPNPLLVGLTWIAGFAWIGFYLRHRQLAPLIVSHFVLAVGVAVFAGEYALNMRVGSTCLLLWPRALSCDGAEIHVLAHAVEGRIDRVVQTPDAMIVYGNAADRIHDREVTTFCLVGVDSGRLEWIPGGKSEATRDSAGRDVFELRISLQQFDGESSWEIYAANANGWYSKLAFHGTIEPLQNPPSNRNVQLFPKQIDGRCEQLAGRSAGSYVSGWAIDLGDQTTPTRLGVVSDGRSTVVPLTSWSRRPDIGSYLGTAQCPVCGFAIEVPGLELSDVRSVAFFAVDRNEVWHPLAWTPKVSERVAETWPRIDLPTYR